MHEHFDLDASALSAGGVVIANSNWDTAQDQGFVVKKVRAAMSYHGLTTTEGPVTVGGWMGLSTAEVKEALDANPQSSFDKPAAEHANRAAWSLWHIPGSTGTANVEPMPFREVYWPYKEKLEENSMGFWLQNVDGSAVTIEVDIDVDWFGTWSRD